MLEIHREALRRIHVVLIWRHVSAAEDPVRAGPESAVNILALTAGPARNVISLLARGQRRAGLPDSRNRVGANARRSLRHVSQT